MAERSMYFNDTDYLAADWAKQFDLLLTDGIHAINGNMGLKVKPSTGSNIDIETGYAYINGYLYINDDVLPQEIDASDTVLDRIDRIVLRLDVTNQETRIQVKKGAFGSNPVPPSLIDGELLKEIPVAQIRINKGTSSITAQNIKDERIPISSLIEIPYEDMADEFNQWFQGKQQSVGVEVYTGTTEPPNMAIGDMWFREVE